MRISNRAKIAFTTLILAASVGGVMAQNEAPKSEKANNPAKTKSLVPMGAISEQKWLSAKRTPLEPGEIDGLIDSVAANSGMKLAETISDEEFVRRVFLDLTGHLPIPGDIRQFMVNKSPNKRAELIDELLKSKQFAEYMTGYWMDVINARATDRQSLILAGNFKNWMQQQLSDNVSWGEIVRQMLTANGELKFDQSTSENGAAYFLLSRRGNDAPTERAAEASRIFMGVQIQCAQCHDHPFDSWKRIQFHQFAAYLSKVRERPIRDEDKKRIVGLRLVSVPFGEHQMEDTDNPKKKTTVFPKFLNGDAPRGFRTNDMMRRNALAESITSKDNPYFAAAFVNRVWGELMGQSFYTPVDDLGPQREAMLPDVIARLAGSFRGSNYDIKQLYRDIMNTDAYQRKIRLGKSTEEHLLATASYPTRLRAEALFQSLEGVLGKLDNSRFFQGRRPNPFARNFGLEGQFVKEFHFDPSTKPEEVEGSIPQALLLMNNPIINQKIEAKTGNILSYILRAYPDNRKALHIVYLRTLARHPSDSELLRCLSHVREVGNRSEAFEDILWTLINSTEFQTRR